MCSEMVSAFGFTSKLESIYKYASETHRQLQPDPNTEIQIFVRIAGNDFVINTSTTSNELHYNYDVMPMVHKVPRLQMSYWL